MASICINYPKTWLKFYRSPAPFPNEYPTIAPSKAYATELKRQELSAGMTWRSTLSGAPGCSKYQNLDTGIRHHLLFPSNLPRSLALEKGQWQSLSHRPWQQKTHLRPSVFALLGMYSWGYDMTQTDIRHSDMNSSWWFWKIPKKDMFDLKNCSRNFDVQMQLEGVGSTNVGAAFNPLHGSDSCRERVQTLPVQKGLLLTSWSMLLKEPLALSEAFRFSFWAQGIH